MENSGNNLQILSCELTLSSTMKSLALPPRMFIITSSSVDDLPVSVGKKQYGQSSVLSLVLGIP